MASGRELIGTTNISLDATYCQYFGAPSTDINWDTDVRILTYPVQAQTDGNFGEWAGAADYVYWVHIYNASVSKGEIGISSPFTQGEGSNTEYGQDNQALSEVHTTITITASPYYGESFKGWYSAAVGGTLYSSSTSFGVNYTNTIITSGLIVYAQWN